MALDLDCVEAENMELQVKMIYWENVFVMNGAPGENKVSLKTKTKQNMFGSCSCRQNSQVARN